MDSITFLWDEKKSKTNLKKHGVNFEEAKTVFADEYGRLIPDPDHSADEDRFILLRLSHQVQLLMVCHCYREEDGVIRIISARKADKAETKQYRDFRHA
ncbi:BrnT family toxin [Beggiatoa alba]|nr:BrnT family toxin [Beggiatoa alba]